MDSVLISLVFLAICMLLILASILIFWIFSKNQKHKEAFKGEYSLDSLVIPFHKGWGIQNLYLIVLSPYSWLIQIIGIILLGALYFIPTTVNSNAPIEEIVITFFASGATAFAFSFFYCALVWFFDAKEREPLRFVISLFLWGTTAGIIASIANSLLSLEAGFAVFVVVSFAPFIEEALKGIGLVFLQFHHEWNGKLDGIVFGFMVGMGFAFVENWGYFANYGSGQKEIMDWIIIIILRTFTTGIIHGILASTTGFIIGYAKKTKKHPLKSLIAFLPAATIHTLYNTIAFTFSGFELILGICAIVLMCIIIFATVYKKNEEEGT